MAKALEWDRTALLVLEFGAILQDVGKIAIPDEILNKSGKLSREEQEIMRSHTELGTSMLKEITHLQAALLYILYHHERWDGQGYPHQLVGGGDSYRGTFTGRCGCLRCHDHRPSLPQGKDQSRNPGKAGACQRLAV
ncbi:MAG: HD domain-containing phosphohydrolase [Anaerolineae bacterium]|nr:HD domain-containing phosphohydrolase [Anaerolineae bacterium]